MDQQLRHPKISTENPGDAPQMRRSKNRRNSCGDLAKSCDELGSKDMNFLESRLCPILKAA